MQNVLLVFLCFINFILARSIYYYGEQFTFAQSTKQKLDIPEEITSCCLLRTTTFCVANNTNNLYVWGAFMNETYLKPMRTEYKIERLFRSYADVHCTGVNGTRIVRLFPWAIETVGPALPSSPLITAERGYYHALFLFANGDVYCRGFNNYGQV